MQEIIQNDDQKGLKQIIKQILDQEGISEFELARLAKLHPTTVRKLLSEEKREIRRSTIRQLADALSYRVSFDTKRSKIIFTKLDPSSSRSGLDEFARDVARIILNSDRNDLNEKEKRKIKDIVKMLLER